MELPADVLLKVAENFSVADRVHLYSVVSTEWRSAFLRSVSTLCTSGDIVKGWEVQAFSQCTEVRNLTYPHASREDRATMARKVGSVLTAAVQAGACIESLQLGGLALSADASYVIDAVRRMSSVTDLTLQSGAELVYDAFPNLQSLSVVGLPASADWGPLKKLRKLTLTHASGRQHDSMRGLRHLQSLGLSGAEWLEPAHLCGLFSALPELTEVDLSSTKADSRVVDVLLKTCPQLRSINLRSCKMDCADDSDGYGSDEGHVAAVPSAALAPPPPPAARGAAPPPPPPGPPPPPISGPAPGADRPTPQVDIGHRLLAELRASVPRVPPHAPLGCAADYGDEGEVEGAARAGAAPLPLPGPTLLSRHPLLTHVDLSHTAVGDAGLRRLLRGLPKLALLRIGKCQITDRGLRPLCFARCKDQLRHLSLESCARLTDACLRESVCWLSELRYLSIANCPQMSPDGVPYIANGCRKLTTLHMYVPDWKRARKRLTTETLRLLLQKLPHLSAFSTSHQELDTAQAFEGLHLPCMEHLSLRSCRMQPACLRPIVAACPNLSSLKCCGNEPVSKECLADVGSLQCLTSLRITYSDGTADSLFKVLRSLRKLRALVVVGLEDPEEEFVSSILEAVPQILYCSVIPTENSWRPCHVLERAR
eukprot:TRINITY_DN7301_c0_g2_i1.p1 TRINITY_DN7301_c0_g2~~TRINITY_DN7301_c0_g2_i1.p1  ORF type:complete len:671 (+),score=142.94 TRINITY_DN7301_c0_g2_i1:55-2013(+)